MNQYQVTQVKLDESGPTYAVSCSGGRDEICELWILEGWGEEAGARTLPSINPREQPTL